MNFQPNQTLFSDGLNMRCEKIRVKVTFLEYRPADEHGQDCIILSSGLRILAKSSTLSTEKHPTVEAYGIRGLKQTPWRKTFKSVDALNAWVEKNDAEVHGLGN